MPLLKTPRGTARKTHRFKMQQGSKVLISGQPKVQHPLIGKLGHIVALFGDIIKVDIDPGHVNVPRQWLTGVSP